MIYLIRYGYNKHRNTQLITSKIKWVFIIAGLSVIFSSCNQAENIEKYKEKIKIFDSREAMALEVFKLPATTSKDSVLTEIKERGIYYWEQNIELVNQLDSLDLPDSLHTQNKKLITYCKTRITSYYLLYQTISENTNKYNDKQQACNDKIKLLMNELRAN